MKGLKLIKSVWWADSVKIIYQNSLEFSDILRFLNIFYQNKSKGEQSTAELGANTVLKQINGLCF